MRISLDDIKRFLEPMKDRIMLSIGRVVLSSVKDTTKMQLVKVTGLRDEVLDKVERFQNYGFTSVPLPGAEGAAVFVGGNREHGIVVAMDDRRYRLSGLANGEVAIYTDEGDKIHFKRGKTIEVTTNTFLVNASTKVEINTPEFEVNASTEVDLNTPLVDASTKIKAGTDVEAVQNVIAGVQVTTPVVNTASIVGTGGTVTGTGDFNISGTLQGNEVEDSGGRLSTLRSVYNTHTHNETGTTTNVPNQTA